MKFTRQDQDLMERHYIKFKIFGKEIWWFSTSPNKILNHLKELKSQEK